MFSTPLPLILRETMADFGLGTVDRWWAELDEAARGDVIQLWAETGFSQPCVARVGARFVDATEPDDDPELWHNDFYEYLVNHEAYFLDSHPPHICTLHPIARAAVASGLIPSDFTCPFAHQDCPMLQLLAISPGQSVRLRLTFTPISHATAQTPER